MNKFIARLAALATLIVPFGLPVFAQDTVRVGWQTAWAVQGQLVMGLMHTPIGNYDGLDLAFSGFSYGGPLNQAAVGGEVDVVLTADQPALVLLDRSDDFLIVARMMYNRVCIYAPASGSLKKISDLGGLRISGPVGAAAERVALQRMMESGLDLEKVTFGNLDMAQQSSLLLAAGAGANNWPGVDALYGFDPMPAAFAADGYAKILDCDRVVSVVMMRKSTTISEPRTAAAFMCAFMTAWQQYAAAKPQMNELFLTESKLNVSHAVLDDAASLEPNFAAEDSGAFRFDFTESDFDVFASANRFLVDRGILQRPVDVASRIDLGPLSAAMSSSDCRLLKAKVPYASNP